jgi:hypothetical protein
MINISKRMKCVAMGLVLASVPLLGGCGDNIITWQEDVKLLDGRVITVAQKNRVEEGIPRECWLSIKLAEFGNREIVWHENLSPIVLNVYQNKLYVVGIPSTTREFRQYGNPKPPYIGYRYETGQWQRIPFKEIPEAIYDTNLYFDNMALYRKKHVSLSDKAEMIKNEKYMPYDKRIDPNHVSG